MRSLTIKLTLAFILVSLAGIVLTAVFIQQRTRREFSAFLTNQEKDTLAAVLAEYYRQAGSWQNLDTLLYQTPFFEILNGEAGMKMPRGKMGMPGRRMNYLLADSERRIIFGDTERMGNKISVEGGFPIEVDGQVVGWLITGNTKTNPSIQTVEEVFLRRVNLAILTSAILAVLIAILLGGLLARALTHPLQELTRAARSIAQGELGKQVNIKSRDELGKLASAFNQMSADLARSNQARRQMTADIAHDLRTPLSVILGYTEALSDGKLAGSTDIYQVMHQEAQHLSHLIDDLRTLSLADSGELSLNLVPVHPETLLQRAAASVKPQAEQKGIQIILETEDDLPPIQVDTDRMAQVFGNLLSNALRFTPHGGWIRLKAERQNETTCLSVEDNGAGISAEDLPHIFNRFYRGSKARQENDESGLGLAIAKSFVEAHGGTITVESQLNKGSKFIISLPARRANKDLVQNQNGFLS